MGFTELGNVNSHLADFQEYLEKGAVNCFCQAHSKEHAGPYGARAQQWTPIPLCTIPMCFLVW